MSRFKKNHRPQGRIEMDRCGSEAIDGKVGPRSHNFNVECEGWGCSGRDLKRTISVRAALRVFYEIK